MLSVIFRFLNDLSSVEPVRQSKNTSEAKRVLIETVTQMSTRCLNQGCFAVTCFASHYFFSDYRTLNASGSMDEIRQVPGHYRQQLTDNTSTFMRSCIKGIELLVGQPFSLEKIPKTNNQSIKLPAKDSEAYQQDSGIPVKFGPCSNIPANIRTDIRSTMKKAGYHPDEEGMCYGLAWAALLACVRQNGQAYIQRMQYLAQMDTLPLPGAEDTHQVYPFFDAVTLSMTSYKNMRGYEKGIGYPGRQEVAFPGRVIGGHEPDYQVPVVKQTFIAECTPETFIRFLQQTQKNNNGIPFGVMIHYPGHATSIGFDGSKWLAADHDNHYYTETTERLYNFFDEQVNHYKDGRIIAAIEVVAGNEYSLNITSDTLVINAKKSVSAPLALHLALQYGDVKVTTECITAISQQTHSPEILLEKLACKDARGAPGLYMALQKGYSDAITAFMQASASVITALPLPEIQKAELLCRLFSSKNACFHSGAQTCPQEITGDRNTSRKRTSSGQTDPEAKRSKANSQTHSQETSGNSIASRKRTPYGQTGAKAKRNKRLSVKEKQGTNLQTGTAAQGSRPENTESGVQGSVDISACLSALKKHLTPVMNDKESEAVKKLFRVLNSKKIRIKETFYKLLANNVERKDLPSFCAKASVFFAALTNTIKDTGCLTGMLGNGKKYSQNFIAREDADLEYLAGLDLFRCFSSMNARKGLPKKESVEEMLDWNFWKLEGAFCLELFCAFSSMNNGKGLPAKEEVEDFLDWDVWKQEGTFNLELLHAFSSMNNGKGLPRKEEVEAVLAWELWKPEGVFSVELFRAFSSMNSSKGLPKKEAVEEVLSWKIWKPEGTFNLELFRACSSMNNCKGLPKKKAIEEILGWDVWKPEGVFNMELFRTFSSMNSGRGLPKKEAVEEVLSWKIWKPEGTFNLELFRACLSMNSCKGLPKKKAIEEILGWDVWKPEGMFSMELFRTFSSMNHGKGLPKKEAVEDILGWEVWKQKGVFSLELFRAFSSMNHGKGLPKKEAIEKILGWDVWKPECVFNMELFRTFSSMNSGKGLLKKEAVESVLDWDVWKPEGVFNMELFRAFSSMNSGKGLPKKEAVEEMLDWDVWKPEGVFNMELFRAFSSMNSGKGLPKKEAVEEMLDWDVWKPEGVFIMELFRAFSSMNSGKGLPKKEAVEALLDWELWKPEGVFNMELFRAFSSMNSGKGLPKKEAVEALLDWELWKPEGVFSMDLFRAFSSMNSSKGIPKKEAVEAMLGWKIWKPEGVFSIELFRAFSSMNNGKGLPTKEAVEALLGWELWKPEGVFSMELLHAFSSMNSSKGMPKKEAVEAVLDWVKGEKERDVSLFKLAIRLYASEGIPDIKKLKLYEEKLLNLFFADSTEPESDYKAGNKDKHRRLIQPAALFLSTRKPHFVLNLRDVECFYQQATGTPARKLENLLKLLLSYGGQGVARYLTLNDNDKEALLNLSSLRTPLPLTLQAITDFSPEERRLYLFFTRNLKAPPDKNRWSHLSLLLDKLASVLRNHNNQRRYLEVIWNLAPSDRDTFLNVTHAEGVIAVFPSLNALEKLAKSHSPQRLKALLAACLRFKQGTPSKEHIKRLFTALLETGLPLYGDSNLPDHFLSGYGTLEESATFIPIIPPTETMEKLALHFVTAVMGVLSDMFYHHEGNRLKIEQYGGGIHPFPIPALEIQDKGIKISNWSVDVFRHFLTVTEFPEHYYLSQAQWQKRCTPSVPLYIERRREACRQREGSEPDSTAFKPLSIAALTGLLKSNIPLKPAVWKSFNYHKDKLPKAVHRRLLDEIEKSTCEDIPASLIEYLKDGCAAEALQDEALPQSILNVPTSPSPVTVEETMSAGKQFQRLWAELSRKTLLENTDIQLLTDYKEYMTIEQIVNILKRAPTAIEPCQLDLLRQLLGKKRDLCLGKDPLLLALGDEVASYLMETEI